MKKILSSLLLVFTFPFRSLKKSKIDNFVGGLIFGAIFSLLVNIFTVQIQELINKQRALEALENEIMFNILQVNNIVKQNSDTSKKDEPLNYFYYSPPYSVDFWTQSSDPLRYIAQLDPEIQSAISSFYTIILKNSNELVDRANNIFKQEYIKCFNKDDFSYKNEDNECIRLQVIIQAHENMAAELVGKNAFDVLDYFHPTKDRLNSWYLRILMGDKSTRILSRE